MKTFDQHHLYIIPLSLRMSRTHPCTKPVLNQYWQINHKLYLYAASLLRVKHFINFFNLFYEFTSEYRNIFLTVCYTNYFVDYLKKSKGSSSTLLNNYLYLKVKRIKLFSRNVSSEFHSETSYCIVFIGQY